MPKKSLLLILLGLAFSGSKLFGQASIGTWKQPEASPHCLINNEKLIDKELKDGKLVLTFKRHDACFAAVYPACDGHVKLWKEVYSVQDGKIILEKTIDGKYKKKNVEVDSDEIEFERGK